MAFTRKSNWPPGPASADPQIKQHRQRAEQFEARIADNRRRRAEVVIERTQLLKGEDPTTLAQRLRDGQAVEFGAVPDTSTLDAELRKLDHEAQVLQLAADQERVALQDRLDAVHQAVKDVLRQRVAERRNRVRAALGGLADVLSEYHGDSQVLSLAGYASLSEAAAGASPLPTLGNPADPTSACAAWMRSLCEQK
jgi:hypothetical protein